ncbi:transcriptional regulator, TetR family [Eubacterium uniforme]|uniref:Transcriptional regulator, TetR family n=1 Tax=Eubacterium uniforme TaxID=39495 RepID=A0A1T4VRY2_9FIRM|nr:TetR/AcrR family transcriptional regulator [Eubacterium uniforme]SKA67261.1 transcriptional regulator, TetR family [Eubacterium uniforme]
MNEKFYSLPEKKRNRIINAGFKVFAKNSYKKSPVGEIAEEAGISKSLLFFYFKNKKELYLFLLKTAEEETRNALMETNVYSGDDIFDIMYNGLLVKANMMRKYPDMGNFSIKAYYEKDPDVAKEVRKIIEPYTEMDTNSILPILDKNKFKDGLDLNMMYQDMYLASEGYLWRMQQLDNLDVDKMVSDYKKIIEFWRGLYLK